MPTDGRGVIRAEAPHAAIPLNGADMTAVIIIQQLSPGVHRLHEANRAGISQQVRPMEIADKGSGPGIQLRFVASQGTPRDSLPDVIEFVVQDSQRQIISTFVEGLRPKDDIMPPTRLQGIAGIQVQPAVVHG